MSTPIADSSLALESELNSYSHPNLDPHLLPEKKWRRRDRRWSLTAWMVLSEMLERSSGGLREMPIDGWVLDLVGEVGPDDSESGVLKHNPEIWQPYWR